ncbi:MAG: cohesin domain-containing protein [Dehalococcoidia bacterium]
MRTLLVWVGVAVLAGVAGAACSGGSGSGTGSATPPAGATRAVKSTPVPTPTLTVLTGTGFTLEVPPNPAGAFDVKVNLAEARNYAGYSIGLAFDAAVLKVTGADNGTLLGGPSNAFCAPRILTAGHAELACTVLGTSVTSASGTAAVFHFQATGKGTTNVHFTTYKEDPNIGTFLVGRDSVGTPIPMTIATHDTSITVGG